MDIQIVHVVLGKANPNRMNGVNKVVNSLAEYQHKMGYEVTIWGITKTPDAPCPDRAFKTRLFKDAGKFRLDQAIHQALSVQPLNTVFHIHGAFIPQFYLLTKSIEQQGYDYIYTPHGAYNQVALERSSLKKKVYIQLFEKNIVKYAKSVHFIGESEVSSAEHLFGKIRHVLIPNGQNIEALKFDFQLVKPKHKLVFGFVGRIDIKTKGLDILMQGFAKYLKAKPRQAELWIIGDGKDLPLLKSMAKELGIDEVVRFLGSKFGAEKLNIMANMDFLCLTSRNEGLPGVVLEAAGLRVPCIISRETNLSEYIKKYNAGFYLKQNTSDHLAKILNVADQTHIFKGEKYGNNAYEMVTECFSWCQISKQLIAEYAK